MLHYKMTKTLSLQAEEVMKSWVGRPVVWRLAVVQSTLAAGSCRLRDDWLTLIIMCCVDLTLAWQLISVCSFELCVWLRVADGQTGNDTITWVVVCRTFLSRCLRDMSVCWLAKFVLMPRRFVTEFVCASFHAATVYCAIKSVVVVVGNLSVLWVFAFSRNLLLSDHTTTHWALLIRICRSLLHCFHRGMSSKQPQCEICMLNCWRESVGYVYTEWVHFFQTQSNTIRYLMDPVLFINIRY